MRTREIAPAVPLWINGHAYLTVPAAFHDVRVANGEVLRRTPLCGAAELAPALVAARTALPAWRDCGVQERSARLGALAGLLERYAAHFAGLIAEESGGDLAGGTQEVEAVLGLIRAVPAHTESASPAAGVVAIVAAPSAPFSAPLVSAIPALLAGSTLILRPPPQVPSPLLAFAELTARCDFPAGVCNVVHGGEAMTQALVAQCETRFAPA